MEATSCRPCAMQDLPGRIFLVPHFQTALGSPNSAYSSIRSHFWISCFWSIPVRSRRTLRHYTICGALGDPCFQAKGPFLEPSGVLQRARFANSYCSDSFECVAVLTTNGFRHRAPHSGVDDYSRFPAFRIGLQTLGPLGSTLRGWLPQVEVQSRVACQVLGSGLGCPGKIDFILTLLLLLDSFGNVAGDASEGQGCNWRILASLIPFHWL